DRLDRESALDLALLAKGFHVVVPPLTAQIGPVKEQWDAVYKMMVEQGFSKFAIMEGKGSGGGDAYAWAIENPEKIACVVAENPLLRSPMSKSPLLDGLAPLARSGVPLLHTCGSLDPWLESQTREMEKRYKELGGSVSVMIQEGEGHRLSWRD